MRTPATAPRVASTAIRGRLILIAALALGSLLLIAGTAGAAEDDRPNVVVVMTDDQDVASLRVMPAVRRTMARQGTAFTNSFATFPLCCPSRATFLTGQYAHNHGVLDNKGPKGGYAAFDNRGSLPVTLRRSGYRTGFVGKYLTGYPETPTPEVPRGWSEWYAPWGNRAVRMFGYQLNENGRPRRYGSAPADYQTDVLARKARQFIRRGSQGRKPFFLTLATGAPHTEGREEGPDPRPAPRHRGRFSRAALPKPPSFNERDVSDKPSHIQSRPRIGTAARLSLKSTNRDRLASLLAVDDAVQGIVNELAEGRELRDTLLIFTSDNGFLLGEHRLRAKTLLYEESVRVPLLMRGPGIPAGAERRQITGNIDLAPTILDVAETEPGHTIDGVSLLPFARNPRRGDTRDILLENTVSAAVRTSRYTYAEHSSGETELYDLQSDPFQLHSRHDDPALDPVEAGLARRLDQLRACAGEGCR
jgi:arylsulfatase A-like enzyme